MAQYFGTIGMIKMDKKTKRPKVGAVRERFSMRRLAAASLARLPALAAVPGTSQQRNVDARSAAAALQSAC